MKIVFHKKFNKKFEKLPQKTKEKFYEKLRSYIDYGVYPGEVFIVERGLYIMWRD